jgi:hypothetical protein
LAGINPIGTHRGQQIRPRPTLSPLPNCLPPPGGELTEVLQIVGGGRGFEIRIPRAKLHIFNGNGGNAGNNGWTKPARAKTASTRHCRPSAGISKS